MSNLELIGESSVLMKVLKFKYEWKIRKFSSHTRENFAYKSEKFNLPDSTWYLVVSSNYKFPDFKYVSLSLYKDLGAYPVTVDISLGIKTMNQIIVNEKKSTCIFNNNNLKWTCRNFLEESKLQRRKSELLPSDTLTIICSIVLKDTPLLQARYRQLSEDLKHLFNSQENTDVALIVREKVYLAHKSILSSRSPVLAAMFKNDMEEKKTGIVNIPDCDPEAFNIFLIFLYSGSVDFSKCNICELYKITEKYDISELKLMCVDFMTKNISVDNFCEILIICDQFNDVKLLIEVQRYFHENFEKVVFSENWEFLLENNYRPVNNLLKQMAPRFKMA